MKKGTGDGASYLRCSAVSILQTWRGSKNTLDKLAKNGHYLGGMPVSRLSDAVEVSCCRGCVEVSVAMLGRFPLQHLNHRILSCSKSFLRTASYPGIDGLSSEFK